VNVIGGSTGVSETLQAARQERSQQPGGRIISRRDSPLSRFRSQSLRGDFKAPEEQEKKKKKEAAAEANKNKIKKQDTGGGEGQRRVRRHLRAMALQGRPAAGDRRDRP